MPTCCDYGPLYMVTMNEILSRVAAEHILGTLPFFLYKCFEIIPLNFPYCHSVKFWIVIRPSYVSPSTANLLSIWPEHPLLDEACHGIYRHSNKNKSVNETLWSLPYHLGLRYNLCHKFLLAGIIQWCILLGLFNLFFFFWRLGQWTRVG